MKILIINLHSSRNAGDAALALASLQQLQTNFPGVMITLAMNDPVSHKGKEVAIGSFFTWFVKQQDGKSIGWRWFVIPWLVVHSFLIAESYRLFKRPIFLGLTSERRKLLQAYLEADLIISCPGNMLMTFGRFGLPLLVTIYTLIYAWLVGKPLYMLPQSIGPFKRHWERALVKWALSKMRLVMVREPVSYNLLSEMGLDLSRCYLVPDIAFALPPLPRQIANQFLTMINLEINSKRPVLGITVINWGAQNRWFSKQAEYEEAVLKAVQMFINKHHGHVIFFPQVCGPTEREDDRIPARRIVARLTNIDQHITLVDIPLPPELLKALYGLMDIFLGTRMHSNIFALSEGVPVLAIGYLYKTRGIMEMLQLADWVIDIDQLNSETLATKLEVLWLERDALRRQIQDVVSGVVQQINQAGTLIAADFAALLKEIEA